MIDPYLDLKYMFIILNSLISQSHSQHLQLINYKNKYYGNDIKIFQFNLP